MMGAFFTEPMASIIDEFDVLAGQAWQKEWRNPVWKQFVLTGDATLLNSLPKFKQYSWLPSELLRALPLPDQIEITGQRFLQACLVANLPEAGVDVFVATEGMYVGIDMYADITLGKMFFIKHGSGQIGSYVYDEPGNHQDARLVPFGEVPPIAFSEAMGDLRRIAGKDKISTQETTEQ
jgi:hypothetical protein